jgi:hypothetical protein
MPNPEINTGQSAEDEQQRLERLNERILSSQSAIESAASVIERMDHKDKLYGHLGGIATGNVVEEPPKEVVDSLGRKQYDASGNVIKTPGSTNLENEGPRTKSIPERLMARRLERKRWNKEVKEASRNSTVKAFGGEQSNTMNLGSRLVGKINVASNDIEQLTGQLTPREARLKKIKSRADTPATENPEQKKSRKKVEKTQTRARRAAKQPILSRWRDRRRVKASDRIDRHEQAIASAQEEIDRIRQAGNNPEDNSL